jgi:hypothetical protein
VHAGGFYLTRLWRFSSFFLALLFCLSACDTGEGMDLRLFCQRYSALEGRPRLAPEQFMVQAGNNSWKYEAYLGVHWMLALESQPGGRLHTIAVVALPEVPEQEFQRAATGVIRVFCGVGEGEAARRLNVVGADKTETLGYQTWEEGGFRLSYYANEAGRYLRVMQIRYLPTGAEPLTLREPILETKTGMGE